MPTATGFSSVLTDSFVSDRSVTDGGVNAVAKAAAGAIYNVAGSLRENGECVLMKADAQNVPYLTPAAANGLAAGDRLAAILSPVERGKNLAQEITATARFSDSLGEWFDASPSLAKSMAGAPIINSRGELVGIAVLRQGGSSCVIRPIKLVADLLAQIPSNVAASWHTLVPPSSSPPPVTPAVAAIKSPTPAKIPLRGARITFSPAPRYPTELRRSYYPIRASGSFRISFDAQGRSSSVQTVRSTGIAPLDEAALSALRNWRAEPGQSWNLVVPITFQP